MADQRDLAADPWRVVVFTVIPGGRVYQMVAAALRPLGHRVVGVVTSPGPVRRRSPVYQEVVAAVPPGVDVLVSNHPERWAAMLAPWRPDLIICGGFPWKIPADVLELPRLGAINFHDALLPRHRGPNATGWALRNDELETGFTIHRLTAEFDTGPILAQGRIPIRDDDDTDSLMAAFGGLIPELLRVALERVARDDAGDPQDERLATAAGLFEEAWRTIDWDRPARTIHNQVRSWIGMRDIPRGALGTIAGQPLRITKTRLMPFAAAPPPVPPGTVLVRDQDQLVIQCGDGPLAVVAWERADVGSKVTSDRTS